jgi:hypothetical protein
LAERADRSRDEREAHPSLTRALELSEPHEHDAREPGPGHGLEHGCRARIRHTRDDVRELPDEPFVAGRPGHDPIGVHQREARLEAYIS